MEQDRVALSAAAGEQSLISNLSQALGLAAAPAAAPAAPPAAPPGPDPEGPRYANIAEEDAYWAGVCDGIRNVGGAAAANSDARLAKATQTDRTDTLDFAAAQLRYRCDGWTPERQRDFVEALAETGVINAAAARVGMSAQSVSRLRRHPQARAFDRACDAAMQIGTRRILSVAYERAIEGTIQYRYYRGQICGEERVYDNRLMIALINRLPQSAADEPAVDPAEEVAAFVAPVEPKSAVAAPAAGPEAEPAAEPLAAELLAATPPEYAVWSEHDGTWFTNCPPPAGFSGYEDGVLGETFYQRMLTPQEEQWWEKEGLDSYESRTDVDYGSYFICRPHFFPWGSEPSSPSVMEEADPAPGRGDEGAVHVSSCRT